MDNSACIGVFRYSNKILQPSDGEKGKDEQLKELIAQSFPVDIRKAGVNVTLSPIDEQQFGFRSICPLDVVISQLNGKRVLLTIHAALNYISDMVEGPERYNRSMTNKS